MARSASSVLALGFGLALTTACPTTLELGAHDGATGEEVAASESGETSATGSGGESSGGSASEDSGSGESTTSAATDTGGESSAESSDGSETDTGTNTETDTGGSETGGGLCDIDGSESPCQICIEQLCCAQLENCAQEGSCLCMVDCIEGDEDPVTCGAQCAPGLSYFEFVQCQAASCAATCI